MVREGYWDFMGRKLREEGPKTTKIDMEGLLKRDITEMQKTVHFLQTRVRDLTEIAAMREDRTSYIVRRTREERTKPHLDTSNGDLESENMLLRIEIQQLQEQLQNSYKRIAELSATVFKKRIAELRNSKPKQLEFNL